MQFLLILYPFLVHAAIIADSRGLEWAAMLLLGVNLLYAGLARRALWAWLGLVAILVVSTWFVLLGDGRYFLYAAPVLICSALAWMFGRTLMPGQVPLITRFAQAMSGPLSPEVQRYTRGVTKFWVALLTTLAVVNLLLALFAPPVVWSLFTNFISYLLLGAVFLGEWLFRRRVLGADEALGWWEYLRGLLRLDYRRL